MAECVECGSTENVISHHTSYEEDETVPVCRECHLEIHSNENNRLYPEDPENVKNYYGREGKAKKHVSLSDEQAEFVDKNIDDLSKFVQDKLRERKEAANQ